MDDNARREQMTSAVAKLIPADLRALLDEWARRDELISFDQSSALNGSLQDYQTAENLYQADREVEAIRIVDRILGIQELLEPVMPRLNALLRSHRHSFVLTVKPAAFGDKIGYVLASGESLLGPQMIRPLLYLRGKCLVALLSDSRKRSSERPTDFADR